MVEMMAKGRKNWEKAIALCDDVMIKKEEIERMRRKRITVNQVRG